ncbi:MAG: hypothetical protein HYS08_09150 [Chlamydiae bacterium]|nr:hypothetical protein [Chlamydiota bacterium]MBI3265529.1 hypothetical protein [Chlamydiota bacterium]
MKKLFGFLGIVFVALAFNVFVQAHEGQEHGGGTQTESSSVSQEDNQESSTASVTYTCPMHPDVSEKEPGKCPICGMNLEEKKLPSEAKKE